MTTEAPPKKPPISIPPRASLPPDDAPDLTDADPADPPELREASLAELLLWRLGVPRDRARMQQQHQVDPINLTPPITTRKVADAIAQISLRIMNGELDATSAKTSLYALQTLLTALRLQIVEEKKARDAKKKKPNPRGRNHANRKR